MTNPEDGGRLVVFGANGGRPRHPARYPNLLARPALRVEAGADRYDVNAAGTEGAERERLLARQLRRTRCFPGFQDSAGRRVPVVALARTDDGAAG